MDEIVYKKIGEKSKNRIVNCFENFYRDENNPKYYYESIWDFMVQYSNIKEKFSDETLSKEIFLIEINRILNKIKTLDNDYILNNFLFELNNVYEHYKKLDKELINIIIYTNIPKEFKNDVNFVKALTYFDLEIFETSSYNLKNEKDIGDHVKNKFRDTGFLLIKYSNYGKDYEFIKNKTLNNIYSFFGYITFINKFNKDIEKWHINEITLDHRLTDLQINALIGTNSNFEIYDILRQYDVLDTAIKMNKSKKIKFKDKYINYNLLRSTFEVKNTKLYSLLKEYFCQFFIAASENIIENSFIKFWSLSERIIKDIHGKMSDGKLFKYMEIILEMERYHSKIVQRIFYIKNKRNKLVHENIHGEITQSDQAIAKVIAENLILFLICFFNEVSEIHDYVNFFKSTDETNKQ